MPAALTHRPPEGGCVPSVLGDALAVVARQVSQQPQHERPRPPPRLHVGEPARNPANRVTEYPQPPERVYAMAYGHCTIVMGCRKP
jgi:hypothetical protein